MVSALPTDVGKLPDFEDSDESDEAQQLKSAAGFRRTKKQGQIVCTYEESNESKKSEEEAGDEDDGRSMDCELQVSVGNSIFHFPLDEFNW